MNEITLTDNNGWPVRRTGAEGDIRRYFCKMAGYGFASPPPYEAAKLDAGYALNMVARSAHRFCERNQAENTGSQAVGAC